jgi:hypothetical protein
MREVEAMLTPYFWSGLGVGAGVLTSRRARAAPPPIAQLGRWPEVIGSEATEGVRSQNARRKRLVAEEARKACAERVRPSDGLPGKFPVLSTLRQVILPA